jgi:hypothetical protein
MNDELRARLDAVEDTVADDADPLIGFERPSDGVLLDAPDGEPIRGDPAIVLPADIWGDR